MNNTQNNLAVVNFTLDALSFTNDKAATFAGLSRSTTFNVASGQTWGNGLAPLFTDLLNNMFLGIAKGQPIEWAISIEVGGNSILVEGKETMRKELVSTAKAIFATIRKQFAPKLLVDTQNLPSVVNIKKAMKDNEGKRLTFEQLALN